MKNILIAGGAGYIGSVTVKKLTQNKKCTHDYVLCHPRECGDPSSNLNLIS